MNTPLPVIVLGIDPGKHGAAVLVGPDGGIIEAHKTPLDGKDYNVEGMRNIIAGIYTDFIGRPRLPQLKDEGWKNNRVVVAIEKAQAMPRMQDGVPIHKPPSHVLPIGIGWGYWHMAACCYHLSVEIVMPKTWQAGIPTKGAKGAALKKVWWAEAKRRWPDFKMTQQLADAALIADQTRRRIVGG